MIEKFTLTTADFAIFSLLLLVSATIGLFFSLFGSQQKTNEEYLLGGKDMPIFPISFSLMASFLSAPTILGLPADMYLFGTHMIWMNLGFTLGPIIASYLFLPIYFKTGVSTSFEYLEKRFGKSTRRILSVIFLLENVLFNGVSLYAPALALSVVTNLSLWTSVIGIGAVCTFYCTIGGIKAVIWTDVFQVLLMYTCVFSIIIKGCLDLGGLQSIFKTAYDGGRIILPTFEMDFSVRYTMWSIFLQSVILTTFSYGGSQVQVQRQLTLKNLSRSKIATLLSIPMLVTFQLLCCFCGLILYANFRLCDPVTSFEHSIKSYDQLIPYYISSAMREYPGLPGLCITGIFSTSLSSISSGVNSMASVTSEDIIGTLWPNLRKSVLITKMTSVFYGALTIFFTYLIASMGNIVRSSLLVIGMIAGPSLGVYLLASLTTTANQMGVNIGVLSGFLFAGFMTFAPNEKHYAALPVQSNCFENYIRAENVSTSTNHMYFSTNFTNVTVTTATKLKDDFSLSFMWITPLSLLVCVVTGYVGSWIISYIKGTSELVEPELLSPVRRLFYVKSSQCQEYSVREKFLGDTAEIKL